jgi:hypothetical protein
VTIKFKKAALADGTELRVTAEAQDEGGAFGIAGVVSLPSGGERSAAGEVAEETATDVVLDELGVGVLGRAADKYARKQQLRSLDRGSSGARGTVSVDAGTKLNVFFHESVVDSR